MENEIKNIAEVKPGKGVACGQSTAPCYLWFDFDNNVPPECVPVLVSFCNNIFEVAYFKEKDRGTWVSCSDHLPFGCTSGTKWCELPIE